MRFISQGCEKLHKSLYVKFVGCEALWAFYILFHSSYVESYSLCNMSFYGSFQDLRILRISNVYFFLCDIFLSNPGPSYF